MDPEKTTLTIEELHQVAQQYLARSDNELEEEVKQRRVGRPKSKRQLELEATKQREELQYTKEGLGERLRLPVQVMRELLTVRCTVMPDLTDHESVQSARYWDEILKGNAGYYRYG